MADLIRRKFSTKFDVFRGLYVGFQLHSMFFVQIAQKLMKKNCNL